MSSLTELPPGQEKVAGARWWTRVSYAGLVLLAAAVIVALVVGFVADREIRGRADAPAVASAQNEPDSAVEATCRPAVDTSANEPWFGADGAAEEIWQQHADELSREYIVGPNGWVFWSDFMESSASQAVGRSFLTTGEVQRWVDYYSSLRDGLEAEGIEFYIVVAPSPSSVYPEQLPEWMQDVRGSTILDQFMAASGGLPVVDLRAPLKDAKTDDVHLFGRTNSHWTDYGGYVAWNQVAACINAMSPNGPLLQVPESVGARIAYDSNEWAPYGVTSPGADWSVPILAEPLPDVTQTLKDGVTSVVAGDEVMDASFLPATTTVEESWTGKSALIVRDSMGNALSPYLQQSYSPTWQYLHLYDSFDIFPDYRQLVAEHHPDVVILQIAERHLIHIPPVGAAY